MLFTILLIYNLSSVFYNVFYPGIQYFYYEHLIIGRITSSVIAILFCILFFYTNQLEKKIHDLKQIQKEPVQIEERFHAPVETPNHAILAADVKPEIIIDTNKKETELLNIPVEDLTGMHRSQLNPEEEIEKFNEIFKKCMQENTAVSEETYEADSKEQKFRVEISEIVSETGVKNG
jgi:PAS domain S-box-containing protein